MDRQSGRIEVLDGLRAMAILLVLASHMGTSVLISGPSARVDGPAHPTWFILNGWTGVELFFVLSGFLITKQLFDPRLLASGGFGALARRFFKKRLCRILPAYYLVYAILSYVAIKAGMGGLHMAAYLLFMQDYIPSDATLIFWSLGVEMKFYLVAPFLILFLRRLSPRTLYGVLAMVMVTLPLIRLFVVVLTPPVTDHLIYFKTYIIPFHMAGDCLIAGLASCFLWQDDRFRILLLQRRRADIVFWAGSMLFFALTALTPPYFVDAPIHMVLWHEALYRSGLAIAFSAMLLGLLGGCAGHRLFTWRALRYIALVSYSLYLIHTLFIPEALDLARCLAPHLSPLWIWAIGYTCLLTLAVPVSFVLYVAVEKPFIDWSHGRMKKRSEL
jgi:peptidoglycan/LPS O-acetylase OafA/YrhL